MKTKLNSLILCIFAAGYSLNAQYAVTTFTESYNELENPISLNIGAGWDDPLFTVPLGFDFEIGELSINQLQQDGLGAGYLGGTFDEGAFLGYFNDLIDASFVSPEPSTITYSVEGLSGDQICKIQYKDCAFYIEVEEGGTAQNRVNFQIWLYESDFAIEYRFGENTVVNPAVYETGGPQMGVVTGIANDGETIEIATVLSGDPMNPTVTNDSDIDTLEDLAMTGTPEDGRVYRFVPEVLSTQEDNEFSYSIYPSPAIDEIRISGDIEIGERFQISDITGKVVLNGLYTGNKPISISQLNNGIYFFSTTKGTSAAKFLVQNY